jgi:hypothetical protein
MGCEALTLPVRLLFVPALDTESGARLGVAQGWAAFKQCERSDTVSVASTIQAHHCGVVRGDGTALCRGDSDFLPATLVLLASSIRSTRCGAVNMERAISMSGGGRVGRSDQRHLTFVVADVELR